MALEAVSAAATAPRQTQANAADKTVWYDCKNLVIEGKGWTDTHSFYDRLPAKAEGKVTRPVWEPATTAPGCVCRSPPMHHRSGSVGPFCPRAI